MEEAGHLIHGHLVVGGPSNEVQSDVWRENITGSAHTPVTGTAPMTGTAPVGVGTV